MHLAEQPVISLINECSVLIHLGAGYKEVDLFWGALCIDFAINQADKNDLETNVSIFVLLLFPSTFEFLQAQAIGGGQIQGTITDANGSTVSGATVEAVQQASGLHRTVTSSGDGGYNLPDLPVVRTS